MVENLSLPLTSIPLFQTSWKIWSTILQHIVACYLIYQRLLRVHTLDYKLSRIIDRGRHFHHIIITRTTCHVNSLSYYHDYIIQ